MAGRRYLLVRHARTVYNDDGVLNGDPRVPVALDAEGRVAAAALARRLADEPFDLALHTRFDRTRETARILLRGRDVPLAVEAGFDDVLVGDFEGGPIESYRAWRRIHGQAERAPGGESRVDALRRYAGAYARLLARRDAACVLLVVHDVPVRFLRNALLRADPLEGPVRTVPNLACLRLGEAELGGALAVMLRRLAGLPPV
jgi:probable phosphoglycerate mutase